MHDSGYFVEIWIELIGAGDTSFGSSEVLREPFTSLQDGKLRSSWGKARLVADKWSTNCRGSRRFAQHRDIKVGNAPAFE
jgi:hypothetical protein